MGDLDELASAARHRPDSASPPRWRWLRRFGTGVSIGLAFTFLAAVVGSMVYAIARIAGTPSSVAPPAVVTAVELMRDYNANEVGADARYRGRQIVVVGEIVEIHRTLLDSAYVMLRTESSPVRQVQCFFPREREPQIFKLSAGQTVVISGEGDGLMIHVKLKDSSLLDIRGADR